MPISLVIADDHPIVLAGLLHVLASEPDFTVLATCSDGEQTLAAVRQHQPDIVLLDLHMPRMGGIEVLRQIRQEKLPSQVVLLGSTVDEDEVLESIRLGVRGVLLKEMPTHLFIQCLRKVSSGGEWMEKRSVGLALENLLKRESDLEKVTKLLTTREIELLKLAASGLSNLEIAQKLYISEGTTKVHLHNIYEKLQLKSRVALSLYAKDKGLV
jgi:DNA-binding NarL/FixJ family response regulator